MPKTKAFLDIKRSIEKDYLGERVPKRYQNRHGKIYNKADIESFAYAVAKSKGIKVEKRKK